MGHAADLYHRNDIRQTSRHLEVKVGERVVADTTRPRVLHETGFAPRWCVPREDIYESALQSADDMTTLRACGMEDRARLADRNPQRPSAWAAARSPR